YLDFPWGHLGEYEEQIASVIVSRRVGDEDVILLGQLPCPEEQSLAHLDAQLRRYQREPVESIRRFRRSLLIARMPQVLRRFLWWLALRVFPRARAGHFGTFGVTTMSPFGARSLDVPSIWSTCLHYGPISETGEVSVAVVFDHRVMDGAVVGHTLLE